MLRSITESLDKMCSTKRNSLKESQFKMVIDLGNRREYVPFDSAWAAKYKAKEWSNSSDVKCVDVIDNSTGEVIYSSQCDVEESLNESKSSMSKMLKKFNTAYNWMYENDFDTYDLMVEGEKLVKSCPDIFNEFVEYRGDLLTSDRELAAFACALGYAGRIVDVDEYFNTVKEKYEKAYEKGLLSYNECRTSTYKKVNDMMNALNITD